MTSIPYRITFIKAATKEWSKLAPVIKEQFRKKLKERLLNPVVPKDSLLEMPGCYKIKLKDAGYRLIYKVFVNHVVVQVVAVGKRDKGIVYSIAKGRLSNLEFIKYEP